MALKNQTYKLLKILIDAMDKIIVVDSIVELIAASGGNDGKYQLNICDTAWLSTGFSIDINFVTYKIIDHNPNINIIVAGPSLPITGAVEIYPPIFMQGTIKATVNEFDVKQISANRLPLIWLHQRTNDKVNTDYNNPVERISDCEIFMLINADFEKWDGQTICDKGIQPMKNLYERFINSVKNNPIVQKLNTYTHTSVDLDYFGVYMAKSGDMKSVFNAYLSGVQVSITIPFLDVKDGCCN